MSTISTTPGSAVALRHDRRADVLASALIVVAALVALWGPVVGKAVFLPLDLLAHMPPWRFSYERTPIVNQVPSDLLLEYYPRRLVANEIIRGGQLPLWNPYAMSGMPLLADGYSALLYPGSLLFLLLPLGQAFGWYALLHLVIAGLGTYWLARGAGLRPLAALPAALAYMWSGFTLSWLAFPDFSPVIAWLPVALGCAERFERAAVAGRTAWRWAMGAGVALALCILCQLQMALYAGVGLGVYWLGRRLLTAPRRVSQAFVALLAAGGLALGLGAAQWLPTLELAREGQRAGIVAAGSGGFHLEGLIALALPGMLPGLERTPPPWGLPRTVWLFPYVGALTLLLALLGAWRANTPARGAALLLALFGFAVTSVPPELLAQVPVFNQLRGAERWLMLQSLALALLAGHGLQNLLGDTREGTGEATNCTNYTNYRAEGRRAQFVNIRAIRGFLGAGPDMRLTLISRTLLLAAGATLLIGALSAIRPLTPGSRYGELVTWLREYTPPFALGVWAGAILLATAGLVMPRFPRLTRLRPVLGLAAAMLIAVDLGWHGLPTLSSARPRELFRPTGDLVQAVPNPLAQLGSDRLFPPTRASAMLVRDPELYRIFAADYPSLQPNLFSVFGAQDVRGYASLFPARYLRFARRWEGKPGDGGGNAQVYLTGAYTSRALLDLMGVRYVFFNPASPNEARYSGLTLVERSDEGAIYRNPTALPRAFLVHRAETLPDDEAVLRRLTSPRFPIGTLALLTEPPPPLMIPEQPPPEPIVTRYSAMEVVVEAAPEAPALLVLSDTHAPGWRAWVNGQPARILPVHSVLRGVAVGPGRSRVVFRYLPESFVAGSLISLGTTFGLLRIAGWVAGRRGSRGWKGAGR
jgi:hypothetical protein